MTINNTEFKKAVIKAIDKVVVQGHLCRDKYGTCYYTSKQADGKELCCPIGHMMPDIATRQEAENHAGTGGSIQYLSRHGFHWAKQFSIAQISMLMKIQRAHDTTDTDVYEFKDITDKEVLPMLEDLLSKS